MPKGHQPILSKRTMQVFGKGPKSSLGGGNMAKVYGWKPGTIKKLRQELKTPQISQTEKRLSRKVGKRILKQNPSGGEYRGVVNVLVHQQHRTKRILGGPTSDKQARKKYPHTRNAK